MADNGMLIGLGVVAVGGYLLLQSGILNNLGGGGAGAVAPIPVTQQTGNFQEQQLVTQTPGIGSIVITPDIILQARSDLLMPIILCDMDGLRNQDNDEGHNADASIKIWEQEHNHMFHTIKERNEHTLNRCNIVHFYRDIDFRRDFDDPIRQHICLNKRVIINEDRLGRRDSPRANSAALDCAQVTSPVIQNCNKCTVNVTSVVNAPTVTNIQNSPGSSVVNKGIAPGANTPPIPHNPPGFGGRASTTPTTPTVAPNVTIKNAITAGGTNPIAKAAFGRAY
jgi:hypothetical protein